MDAVESGHDVMVFSDNVPVEQEVALKRAAAEQGAAGDGAGLRHRGGRRPRPRVRQRRPARPGRHRGGVRHRVPAGARAARPRRRRGDARRSGSAGGTCPPRWAGWPPGRRCAGWTRTRPWSSSCWSPSPRPPRWRPRSRRSPPRWAPRCELALLGAGHPDLTEATEAVLRRLGRDVPAWPVAGLGRRSRPAVAGCGACSSAAPWPSEARIIATGLLGSAARRPHVRGLRRRRSTRPGGRTR